MEYLAWIVVAAADVDAAAYDLAVDNYVVVSLEAVNEPSVLLIISLLVACEQADFQALLELASSSLTLLTF